MTEATRTEPDVACPACGAGLAVERGDVVTGLDGCWPEDVVRTCPRCGGKLLLKMTGVFEFMQTSPWSMF